MLLIKDDYPQHQHWVMTVIVLIACADQRGCLNQRLTGLWPWARIPQMRTYLAQRYFPVRPLLLALCLVASVVMARDSLALPDLRPEIANISVRLNQTVDPRDVAEGCAGATEGRTLLSFDHTAWNDGPSDLSLGDPLCPDCETEGIPVCGNPLFECSASGGHNHAHLRNFSAYTVTQAGQSTVVERGHKEGFCLVNSTCNPDVTPPADNLMCNFLAAGCADVYLSGLGCQYVDITDLEPGSYVLRVELNPLRSIEETSYDNNIVTAPFRICKAQRDIVLTIGRANPADNFRRSLELVGSLTTRTKDFNPILNGFSFDLRLDNYSVLNPFGPVSLPAGRRGCLPQEGWRKVRRDEWIYRNDSGYDQTCQSSIGGLIKSLSVKRVGRTLHLTIRGRVDLFMVPRQPTSASFAVIDRSSNIDNQTCQQSNMVRCRHIGVNESILRCD